MYDIACQHFTFSTDALEPRATLLESDNQHTDTSNRGGGAATTVRTTDKAKDDDLPDVLYARRTWH